MSRAPLISSRLGALISVTALLPTWSVRPPGEQGADAPPLWGRIELVREVAIGANPQGPEYEFAGIAYAVASRSRSVFVVDRSTPSIRKYDAQGLYRGNIGRIGSGPGEYRQVLGLALHGDSLLLVYDPPNGRVVLFDTSGALRRSVQVRGGGLWAQKVFAIDSDGNFAVRTVDRQHSVGNNWSTVYVRHRLTGEVLDSIAVPPEALDGFVLMTSDGPRWSFPATAVYTLLPHGGLATGHSSAYRIEVAPSARARFTIERRARPVPLAGREREEWQAWAAYNARRPDLPDVPVQIPRQKPLIRELFADADGRLWVNLYTQAARRSIPFRPAGDLRPLLTMREHNLYDLFDERGQYLGRVDLPPASQLLAVSGDRVWLGEETVDGEYLLVRYLMRSSRAG